MAQPTPPATPAAEAVTPMLAVPDVPTAAAFYARFGLQPAGGVPGPDGTLQRAMFRHGPTTIHVAPARALPEEGAHGQAIERGPRGLGVILYLQVPDVDAAYQRALQAGARPVNPPMDRPWGDRVARVVDPFGFDWCFAAKAGGK